jgi:hypothetical protein
MVAGASSSAEIERKLDRMMEELRPTAIGYSVGRAIVHGKTEGPKKQFSGVNEQIPGWGQSDFQGGSIGILMGILLEFRPDGFCSENDCLGLFN